MRHRNPNQPPHRQAMTCLELVVVLVVLAGILGTLTLVNRTLRHEAAETRTRHTLLSLQAALRSYATEHAAMPPGNTAHALACLQAHPPAAAYLDEVTLIPATDTTPLAALDGFGRSLRYEAPDASRGRPAGFVSAGLSGRFGPSPDTPDTTGVRPAHRRPAADNLYSFELETPSP